jgi:hypothetical protein
MTLYQNVLVCLVLSVNATSVFAAANAGTSLPPGESQTYDDLGASAKKQVQDWMTAQKLSDAEKQEIENYASFGSFIVASAAGSTTNSTPLSSAPAPTVKGKKTPTQPAATQAPAQTQADADTLPQKIDSETPVKFDSYIKDLTAELKLSDSEAKQITAYYVADSDKLQQLLNDDTLSPLQQAQQVADLRSARNEKIEELLHDFQRQRDFLQVEARYRVALTELAADGGLTAPPAPAPAPPAAK